MPDGKLDVALNEIFGDAMDEANGEGPTRRAAKRDVPRLLAALDGVLKRHAPDRDESSWCAACGFSYPCMTVRDISRHLLGEEGSDE